MSDQSPAFYTNVLTPPNPQASLLAVYCAGEKLLTIERIDGIFVAKYDEANLDAAARSFVEAVNALFGNVASTQ